MQMDDVNDSGGGNYLYGADAPLADPADRRQWSSRMCSCARRENLPTEAGAPGDLTSSTTGVRMAGKFSPRTDYNVEAAIQRGSLGSDTISAWAGHCAGRPDDSVGGRRRYRVFGEYNFASGDETPGDGTRGTFDQLYPTAHDKYGLADQVGWKNIHHLRDRPRRSGRTPSSRSAAAITRSGWRAPPTRFTAPAAPCSPASPTGAPDRHVGQELDIQATYTPSSAHPAARRLRAHLSPARS